MNYILYHDESKKYGYWHGILLIPEEKREVIINYIKNIREYYRYDAVVNFKNVGSVNRVYYINSSFLQLGINSLIQDFKGKKPRIYLGKREKGKKKYHIFNDLIGARFILFRERDDHSKMSEVLDYGGKVETTLRMALKGGVHFLGNDDEPIHIQRIHLDGHEHYGRHVDPHRLIYRLTELREYCSISKDDDVIDDRSSDHKREDSQSYGDCQLLQLSDVMVGSFRFLLTKEENPTYSRLTKPARNILERYSKGRARMMNSRWNNSFCISECYLEDDQWKFGTLEIKPSSGHRQGSLFNTPNKAN